MVETPTSDQLLPESTRRRLDPLLLVARKIRAGAMKGERRSVRRGTSIEFADYRNYSPGDDLRKLDWNVYARLERPYIKLLEDEQDLAVTLLVDTSASMDWPRTSEGGEPAHHKLQFALRLAAGLAYLALKGGDRLLISALSDAGRSIYGPVRGRAQSIAMLNYLYQLRGRGITDLNSLLRDHAARERRAGLTVIISDFFSPNGYTDGLNALLAKGHEVALLHVLAPDELTPPLTGDLRLVDVETGRGQEVTVDATMRHLYTERLRGWLDTLRDDSARKGVHYLLLTTDTPAEKALLFDLRRLGLVK